MTIAVKHFIHLFLLSSIVLINTGCATRLLMEGDRYEPDVEKQQSLIYSYTHDLFILDDITPPPLFHQHSS